MEQNFKFKSMGGKLPPIKTGKLASKSEVVMVEDGDRSTATSDPGMESDRTTGLGNNPRIGAYEQALNDLKAGKITEFEFKKITDDLANPPEENF